MSTVLRLAIQKSGRLSEDSVELIKECGIRFKRGSARLKTLADNYPMELLFLRDDDIPGYVEDGTVDIGIVGENIVVEEQAEVDEIDRLGFAKCRLSIALPRDKHYDSPSDLNGLSIATTYPNILGKFLAEQRIDAAIHEISGSVEIAPSIGLADAVCDIVSTGSTLLSNGLREVEPFFYSQAVLIATPALKEDPDKRNLLSQFRARIGAVMQARNHKYIMLNAPDDAIPTILDILPGLKRPTIVPLGSSGWSSFQSVVEENRFWQVVEELKAAGASGILVMPIEKMLD
jgi:ATP phosphoribosyltransferase